MIELVWIVKLKNVICLCVAIIIVAWAACWHYGQSRYKAGMRTGVLIMYSEVLEKYNSGNVITEIGRYYIKYESGDPDGIIRGSVGDICESYETHEKWIMTEDGWELIE